MNAHRKRRLITVGCILILIEIPFLWFGHEFRQVNLDGDLIACIMDSDATRVDSLLAVGADPNARDTPERKQTFLQRLQALFHPPRPDHSPPALFVALAQRNDDDLLRPRTTAIVMALAAHGANVNALDDHGDTPITALIYPGTAAEGTEILEVLLSAGANTEARTANGETPLMLACRCDHTASVRILLVHGANAEAMDLGGGTALTLASMYDRTASVRMLLAHGANPNPNRSEYGTALSAARLWHNADIIQLLKAHGAKE